MGLSEQILGIIAESGTNDYQQRSALGIARTWVEKRKPHERIEYKEFANNTKRDDLADKLIALFETNPTTRDGYIESLGKARAVINAPFLDSTMNGVGAGKALLKPKAAKEAKK